METNLTNEQQTQVDNLVGNAKVMKPHDLEKFIDSVKSGNGPIELKQAVLDGIEDFQTAREKAMVESAEFTDEEVS